MIYKLLLYMLIGVSRVFFTLVYPIRVTGRENLPKEGGYMLCGNHISLFDPFIVVLFIKRHVRVMAKKELFSNKAVAGVIREAGAFPVDRGHADLSAVREAIKALRDGECLCLFPQGTRTTSEDGGAMHTGAAMIIQRTGSPVIPMYIDGPYKLFRRTNVRIGAPIDLSEFGKRADAQTIAQITERINNGIFSMK